VTERNQALSRERDRLYELQRRVHLEADLLDMTSPAPSHRFATLCKQAIAADGAVECSH